MMAGWVLWLVLSAAGDPSAVRVCRHPPMMREWERADALLVDWSEVSRTTETCGRCSRVLRCDRYAVPSFAGDGSCFACVAHDVLPCGLDSNSDSNALPF